MTVRTRIATLVIALGTVMPVTAAAGQAAPAGHCVWAPVEDQARTEAFLGGWAGRTGLGTLQSWGVSLDGGRGRVQIVTGAGAFTAEMTLGDDCADPPDVTFAAPAGWSGQLPDGGLDALAKGFETRKATASDGAGSRNGEPLPPWMFPVVVGLLALATAHDRGRDGRMRLFDRVAISLLFLWAAFPLFDGLLAGGAALRVAWAGEDIFGDPGHPFLFPSMLRAVLAMTIEPWALRLVPFACVLAEAHLLATAAARRGGRLAGMLAAGWLACEVRRRHGLTDVSDWDLAGAMLVAILLWTERRRTWAAGAGAVRRDLWAWAVAAVLAILAVSSSWLTAAPVAALVLLGWVEVASGRERWQGPAMLTAVVACLALATQHAARFGGSGPDAVVLLSGAIDDSPVGRSVLMAIPLAAGLVWLVARWRALAARFVMASVAAVFAAMLVAVAAGRHVSGGYYFGLVTPLLLYAAGVGCARGLNRLAALLAWSDDAIFSTYAPHAMALVLVAATVRLPAPSVLPDEVGDQLVAVDAAAGRDDLPILTNEPDLERLVIYEKARRGYGDLHDILEPPRGPRDLRTRVRVVADCKPGSELAALWGAFYLAVVNLPDARGCVAALHARCEPVLEPVPAFSFLRCRR